MRKILTSLVLWLALATSASAEEYTIKRGDNLRRIVQQHSVGQQRFTVEDFLVANPELLERALKNCASKPAEYRTSETRKGYFCNEVRPGRFEVGSNSIVAGWKIRIPTTSAPADVASTVASIPGRRIALVVDATGSMNGNIGLLADQYRLAVRQHGKEVIGVWLFSDGKVWKVAAEHFLANYKPGGSMENAYEALQAADAERPDAILFFTDEPGDTWPRDGRYALTAPIFAHCLPQNGVGPHTCDRSLRALVAAVPGSRYVPVATERREAVRAPAPAPTVQVTPGHVPPIERQRPESPMDHVFKR